MPSICSVLYNMLKETANPYTMHTEDLSSEQIDKQAAFESFDYYKSYPEMYMNHLRQKNTQNLNSTIPLATLESGNLYEGEPEHRIGSVIEMLRTHDQSRRNSLFRWLIHVWIAIAVGIVATFISYAVEYLENYKANTLYSLVRNQRFPIVGYFIGYIFWVSVSVFLVAIASAVIVFLEPAAGGGGIPDVIAYLNGVQVKKAMNIKTFFAKSVSCVCAVSGSFPVGLEAPLIHLGAITGAGVTQGRSRTLGCQTSLFSSFRNNKDRRDFITAGAACGVSAAFGAPIGGLLFVMEEVSSFWDHSSSGQIFLATMICFSTISIIHSLVEDKSLLGWVSNAVSVLFEVNLTIPLNLLSILPSIVLGILCGVMAALFTKFILIINKIRSKTLRLRHHRFLEPVVIAFLYCSIMYICSLVPDCRPIEEVHDINGTIHIWGTENRTRLFNATCSAPDTYSPFGTLTMGTGKNTIRHLFSRQTVGEFPGYYIFLFFALYIVFSCWASGAAVSGGLVVPSLVIGATFGRLFGLFLWSSAAYHVGLPKGYRFADAWMDPGVFALIGAGAFFSGTSRMTMSICVIMVELSSELHYLLPVMVAIVMSKTVADFISEPLYHQMLHLDCVPYLEPDLQRNEFEQLTAADVMSRDVVILRTKEKTTVVLRALRETTHHAFPVVEARDSWDSLSENDEDNDSFAKAKHRLRYKFVGLVTREDIQVFLALPALKSSHTNNTSVEDWDTERKDREDGQLSPRARSVNAMTWREWVAHKTSLFLISSSTQWHENWSLNNNPSHNPNSKDCNHHNQFVDETKLPTVIDISLIVNRSPWVIPPFFNLQMAYHTFRMMGLRHMIVIDGESVCGMITRKDLLVDSLRRRMIELKERIASTGETNSFPPSFINRIANLPVRDKKNEADLTNPLGFYSNIQSNHPNIPDRELKIESAAAPIETAENPPQSSSVSSPLVAFPVSIPQDPIADLFSIEPDNIEEKH